MTSPYPLHPVEAPASAIDMPSGDLSFDDLTQARIELAAAEQKIENLTIALVSNRDIGVAIGILMVAHRIPKERAFDLLRVTSQHTHRKLRDVADEVTMTGALPGRTGQQRTAEVVHSPERTTGT